MNFLTLAFRRSGATAAGMLIGALLATAPSPASAAPAPANPEYPDFYTGEGGASSKGIEWVQAIAVSAPAYGADIKGDVTVTFAAPGMTQVQAMCWQQPTAGDPSPWGHDANVAPDLKLDASGNGSFVFHADQFPSGPITVRIRAKDDGKKQDLCELQLFNQGGAAWNQGIPKADPPAARGMKLAFSDDFDGPLSISRDGKGARYESHKTGGGDFSGWRFSDNAGENNPFSQVGTWLRIRATKKPDTKGSTGIISSAHEDKSGFYAAAPCYFECRLVAQSAPGTWPAFWLLSGKDSKGRDDEIDVIEAYGGWGPKNPGSFAYRPTTHFWKQPLPDWAQKGPDGKTPHPLNAKVEMTGLGGKSAWSTTFHTYAVLITEADTAYYLDDLEVLRHPSGEISKTQPFFFMVNYSIGGISGWQIDLGRYGNQSDMWVDYVRVYQGEKK